MLMEIWWRDFGQLPLNEEECDKIARGYVMGKQIVKVENWWGVFSSCPLTWFGIGDFSFGVL